MANVVITGGSRGIGAAAVKLFAQKGYRVFFLYEKEHDAAKAVCEATGAQAFCCDVADAEAVKAAFAQIGHVDILICNAGIVYTGLMSQMEESQWDRIFDVNVKGIYHCVNAAMGAFLQTHSGCIITVSSMWGQVGASCEVAYSAAKAGVIGLTKALAKELAPSGITVNCIAPGVINTKMNKNLTEADMAALRDADILNRYLKKNGIDNIAYIVNKVRVDLMERKLIPLTLMLIAGAMCSIVCFAQGYDAYTMLWALFIVLLVFYIIDIFTRSKTK